METFRTVLHKIKQCGINVSLRREIKLLLSVETRFGTVHYVMVCILKFCFVLQDILMSTYTDASRMCQEKLYGLTKAVDESGSQTYTIPKPILNCVSAIQYAQTSLEG